MFSKKPADNPPPQSTRQAARTGVAGATFSILGADMAVTGDIVASADLHIDGRIEGDVSCQALVQGESSEVIGAIKAESAKLAGMVRGTITAGSLVILKSAQIHGDVFYDSLTIEPGAQVDGRLSTRNTLVLDAAIPASSSEPLLTLASSAP